MSKPPSFYMNFKKQYPGVAEAYEKLGEECQNSGPLSTKERAIAKLAIAIGAGLEGGVHSHTRRAQDAGVTADEIRHIVLLALTTIGFPSTMKALSWIDDILQQK